MNAPKELADRKIMSVWLKSFGEAGISLINHGNLKNS